tara:strand:- start:3223 stop:3399 length:177 start_codon:yes stop_codon:yes gene_type:complete
MLSQEIGFVFLYVAAFGFSDYFVKLNNLKGLSYLMYYTLLGIIAVSILYYNGFFKNKI